MNPRHWVRDLEFLERVLLIDNGKFSSMSRLDLLDHVNHKLTDQVKNFKVVVFEFHLHIETRELAQVSVCIRVLSSENWSNLEHTF